MLPTPISAPVVPGSGPRDVTKKSHLFQISNHGRISDWQIGQIRSPYARPFMGVSSFTYAPLVGAFFLAGAVRTKPSWPRGDCTEITTTKRLRPRVRPARQRGRTFLRKRILAALNAEKPAVDVAQQNFRRIRYGAFDLRCTSRTAGQRSRARQRLLAVGGHDRRLAGSAENGIAETPTMFVDEARAAPWITAGTPRPGLDQDLDASARRYAKKAEAEQSAKFAHARIALAAAATRHTHGKPDLIASRRPIDALQHKLEIEAELQFADHDERRLLAADGDEVAAADLALHLEAEGLEEALHREVERRLPRRKLRLLRSLTRHGCPSTRRTGFARARQSRCCRNHVADVVSASLTRAASPRRIGRRARGRRCAPSRGNDVPVVILLRSRIDSVMCRQRALHKAHGLLLARPRKAPVFLPLQAQRSLSFRSRIISPDMCAFRASEEGNPSWRAKR